MNLTAEQKRLVLLLAEIAISNSLLEKYGEENSAVWELMDQLQEREMAQEQDKERAQWIFNALYADTEVRSVADDKLLAVVHAGPEQARIVSLLKGAPQSNAALADGEKLDLFAVALFLSCRHDPTCVLRDENAERAIGLLLRLSGFELPAPPTLNASKEAGNG